MMDRSPDRLIHADALRRHQRTGQVARVKRQLGIMLASVALGGMAFPLLLLDRHTFVATGAYLEASAKIMLLSGAIADPPITIRYEGQEHEYSSQSVVANCQGSADATLTLLWRGSWLGFGIWLAGLLFSHRATWRRRERALRDRVIAGTLITSEKRLARLTGRRRITGRSRSVRCQSHHVWKPAIWR